MRRFQVLSIIFSILLFAAPLSAQTAEEFIQQALKAGERKDYKAAGQFLEKAAEQYRGEPKKEAQAYGFAANAYLKAAQLLEERHQYSEAAIQYFEVSELLLALKGYDKALMAATKASRVMKEVESPSTLILYNVERQLATLLDISHRWPEAFEAFVRAEKLAQEIAPHEVPEIQITMGSISQVLGRDKVAVEYFRKGIEGHNKFGQQDGVRDGLKHLGALLSQRRRYEEALPVWESLVENYGGDTSEKALDARFRLAFAHEGLKQYDEAYAILTKWRSKLKEESYRRNLDKHRVKLLWKAGRDQEAEELLASDAFLSDYQRGEVAADQQKRKLAERLFVSYLETAAPEAKVGALNHLAYRLLLWDRPAEAEKYLREGLSLHGDQRDKTWATLTLNLGESYLKRGNPSEALTYFEQSLEYYSKEGPPESHATVLNNAAACHSSLGNLSKSITYLERAVEVVDRFSKPSPIQATVANALGYSYVQMGRYDDGIIFYKKALARHQASGNAKGERTVLFNMGAAMVLNKQSKDGFANVTDALDLALEAKDTVLQSLIFGFIAEQTTDPELRRSVLDKAEALIPKLENLSAKAFFLNQKAQAEGDSGDWKQARALALESLSLFPEGSGIEQAFSSRRILLDASLNLNEIEEARRWSVPLLHDVETRLWGLSSREARSFMFRRSNFLGRYCIALLKNQMLEDAFTVVEKGRSLGLAALTRDVKLDEGRVSARLLEERSSLSLSIKSGRAEGSQLDALISQYRIVLDKIEREYAMAGLVTKVATVKIEDVQKALEADEALLEFVSDGKSVHLILVRKGLATSHFLGTQKEIGKLAKSGYKAVSKYRTIRSINKSLKPLAGLLLKPLGEELGSVKKMVIIPSDGLYSVPFAALPRGEGVLIDDFEITVTNSASSWLASRSMLASGSGNLVAALGDHSGASEHLVPLPQTGPEAESVVKMFPNTKLFVGSEMKADRLRLQAQDKQRLHFATHGFTDDKEPLLSGLDFSDQRVTAADIFGWQLSAELAVLSACESSGFSERNRFLGLTSAFQYAGVRTLVVSLWSVSDEATEYWMEKFYRGLSRGKTPSAAMRAAHIATKEKWPNPFFWAPFTTWGDGLSLGPKG